MSSVTLETLIAQQQIRETLYNYCRALDRMDKALAYSVWHQDGTALYHDMFEGSGHGFIDWVWQAHTGLQRHSHQITNCLIDVDGATAVSESYVTVALWTLPDDTGAQQEIIGRGRYLDRWEQRHGDWAIVHREHLLDMQTLHALTPGYVSAAAARDASDPSFDLFDRA